MQTVKFARNDSAQFFKTLRSRVNAYFEERNIPKTGNTKLYVKAVLMLLIYIVPFILLFTGIVPGWWNLLLFAWMGIGEASVGLCVMHDANHGSFSSNKWVNEAMSISMNLIGGSIFTWRMQHNILHHSFTNIYELDEDIDDKPFLRLSPHGKKKPYHRFQHIYALFLYAFATISWATTKDFKQLIRYNREGITKEQGFSPSVKMIRMIISKLCYYIALLVLPLLVLPWPIVVVGFLVMHLISGFYITVIFQLAHVVEGTHHMKLEPNKSMENTWAIHQIRTTANFSTKNKFLTYIVGGLNHQIEHHLFPNIAHIHYPEISKIVRSTANEFGFDYIEYDNIGVALASHLKMLKQFGNAAA